MYSENWVADFFKKLLMTGAFSCALAIFLNIVIAYTPLPENSQGYKEAMEAFNSMPFPVLVILAVFVAPVTEELAFRGLLYGLPLFIIQKASRRRTAGVCLIFATVSSVIFGIYHENIVQFVYALLMGLAMCLVYEAHGGLFWTVLFHFTANFTSLFVGFLPGAEDNITRIWALVITFPVAMGIGRSLLHTASLSLETVGSDE
jgi:hypothetical protein